MVQTTSIECDQGDFAISAGSQAGYGVSVIDSFADSANHNQWRFVTCNENELSIDRCGICNLRRHDAINTHILLSQLTGHREAADEIDNICLSALQITPKEKTSCQPMQCGFMAIRLLLSGW